MFTDNHRADENLALAARELASRGGAVAPSKATFVLRDPGNSDGAAEPTSREPALESVVVTLDRRIAEARQLAATVKSTGLTGMRV